MPSAIRSTFRVKNVENFIKSTVADENTLYIGIGRPQYWDVSSSSDGAIPSPANNILSENNDWTDLMSLKKINSTNMSHCVPRRKWQANEKYDAFRHDWTASFDGVSGTVESVVPGIYPIDISESKFYCITDNGTAFICVKQGLDGLGEVVASTQSPQDGTSTIIAGVTFSATSGLVVTSDGYVWKKVATLTTTNSSSFMTTDYYPVKTYVDNPGISDAAAADQWSSQTNSASHGGGVCNINVISQTTNWSIAAGNYHITDAVNGSTAGAPATKILSAIGDGVGLKYLVTIGDNIIKNIIVTDPGQGYTFVRFVMGTAGYSAGGAGSTLEAIFTPMRGIGVDPVRDLVAHNLVINSTFDSDENDKGVELSHREFTVSNEYRKLVVVSNPKLQNGTLATGARLDMTHYMTYTGTTPPADAIVKQNSPNVAGRVVDSSATQVRVLRYNESESGETVSTSPYSDFAAGTYTTVSPAGTFTVSTVLEPEVKHGSGDIIYSDYRRPILRDINQLEDIKIVIEY